MCNHSVAGALSEMQMSKKEKSRAKIPWEPTDLTFLAINLTDEIDN